MRKFTLAVLMLLLLADAPAAFAEGHYVGGFANLRDFVSLPKKGFVSLVYNPYYWSSDYRSGNGHKVKQVSETRSIKLTERILIETTMAADISLKVSEYTLQPLFFYFSDWEILGAKYAVGVAPSYVDVSTRLTADITGDITINRKHFSYSASGNKNIAIKESDSGFGDMMVRPAMLDWAGKDYDVALAYSFYAPTGSYDKDRFANVGLGYWSHEISLGGLLYPGSRATALLFNATYEINTRKSDSDITPGQNIILEYGIDQYLSEAVAVAITGSSYFQISNNTGGDAFEKGEREVCHSVGAEISLWPIPNTLGLVGRYNYQYYAENTLRGQGFNATVRLIF